MNASLDHPVIVSLSRQRGLIDGLDWMRSACRLSADPPRASRPRLRSASRSFAFSGLAPARSSRIDSARARGEASAAQSSRPPRLPRVRQHVNLEPCRYISSSPPTASITSSSSSRHRAVALALTPRALHPLGAHRPTQFHSPSSDPANRRPAPFPARGAPALPLGRRQRAEGGRRSRDRLHLAVRIDPLGGDRPLFERFFDVVLVRALAPLQHLLYTHRPQLLPETRLRARPARRPRHRGQISTACCRALHAARAKLSGIASPPPDAPSRMLGRAGAAAAGVPSHVRHPVVGIGESFLLLPRDDPPLPGAADRRGVRPAADERRAEAGDLRRAP